MDTFLKLVLCCLLAFLMLRIFNFLRTNPKVRSRAAFGKSMTTMGMLALVLIAFVMVLVLLLRT